MGLVKVVWILLLELSGVSLDFPAPKDGRQ
jgi:hypothetical protein